MDNVHSTTRRAFLKAVPAAGAALAVLSAPAEAARPAAPVTLGNLALQFRDAAQAIDPTITGAFIMHDEIMDGPRDMRVAAVYLERPHAPMIRRGVKPTPSPVAKAISAHRKAWQAFEASCPNADDDDPRYGGPTAEALRDRLCRRELRLFKKLLAMPTDNPRDTRLKAEYVRHWMVQTGSTLNEDQLDALLRSMAGVL